MKKLNHFWNLLENKIPFCVVRFNDGEMGAIMETMAVVSRSDQKVTKELSDKLLEAILHKQKDYYIGLPDKKFKNAYQYATNLIGDYEYLTSSVIFHNGNWAEFLHNIPKYTKQFERVVWVGSENHNTDKLPFKVTEVVNVNHKDAFNSFKKLNDMTPLKNTLIFLACGPLGRIIGKEWFEREPECTILEIGSVFDPFVQDIKRNYQKKYWNEYINYGS